MIEEVRQFIERHRMFEPGDLVIAAVSGGADSVCLLQILDRLSKELHISLFAVHVHHGLRGQEADRDAAFTEELCGQMGIGCRIVRRDVGGYAASHGISEEEAGRILRYEALEAEAAKRGAARIAVAHHGDDNAETILHNLFRGSGLKGLGGIAPVRGRIVRPLLEIPRARIMQYLKDEGLSYCEDSTNSCNDYTRNRLRNKIIPLIREEINSRAVDNVLHAGNLAFQADNYLGKLADSLFGQYGKLEDGCAAMPVSVMKSQDSIMQTYLILRLIREISRSGKDITARHVKQVQELIEKPVGRQTDLPYGLRARRTYEELRIESANARQTTAGMAEKALPKLIYQVFFYKNGLEIPRNRYTKWFDYGRIKDKLSLRTRREGDYIILAPGVRKSVKSYMIDNKIPREERNKIPLLADGNHVIWMIGYRISEYYKVTDQTELVLQVKMDGGNDNAG